MISLSQTTGYAILALGCIGSWKGDRVRSEAISDCTGVPKPYLRKLLYALRHAGLVEAKRGHHGGFALARPPSEITLLEIAEAVEPKRTGSDCLLGLPGCSDETPCPMHAFWKEERSKIQAELGRTSLAKAAQCVREARWGKLTKCPGEDYVPRSEGPKGTALVKGCGKSKPPGGHKRS
jgi:Rrf2 family transcriptional regulator, iron-sulfur cluster assembly transcription factor